MRKPRWHRDEIILALDLYFDADRGPIDDKNPRIQELSQVLNQLPIQAFRPDAERFRNPNGVTLKLSNFLAIDPSYAGKGMESYSKLDEQVFFEFREDKEKLRQIASTIRAIAQDKTLASEINLVEPDLTTETGEAIEGEILYRLHKLRERNSNLAQRKKRAILGATGKLECEVCGFDFGHVYGHLGEGYIECHHKIPLHQLKAAQRTNLEDLSLVCANCHRMLHKSINTLTIDELTKIVKPF